MEQKFPLPPFNFESATQKVQLAEDAWNSQDPVRVSLAYTVDTEWRNRSEFINGRENVVQFLSGKWQRELDYKLKKNFGRLQTTVSQYVLSMNITMQADNGFVPMVTKTGNLMKMG